MHRGCPPPAEQNPWGNGQPWESKTRCKKNVTEAKHCTCRTTDDQWYCNHAATMVHSAATALVLVVLARLLE